MTNSERIDNQAWFASLEKLSEQYLNVERRTQSTVQAYHEETKRRAKRNQEEIAKAHEAMGERVNRALYKLLGEMAEEFGRVFGSIMANGSVSFKNFFASFLDMLGQFSITLGTVALGASKIFTAMFSGNPAALFAGGLAMIAIGGVVKAFASQLRSGGSGGGSQGSQQGGGNRSGQSVTTASFFENNQAKENESAQTVNYYHFEGGLYDERALARIAANAINHHAGLSAPKLRAFVVEG